jgi:hypothetical protein
MILNKEKKKAVDSHVPLLEQPTLTPLVSCKKWFDLLHRVTALLQHCEERGSSRNFYTLLLN